MSALDREDALGAYVALHTLLSGPRPGLGVLVALRLPGGRITVSVQEHPGLAALGLQGAVHEAANLALDAMKKEKP